MQAKPRAIVYGLALVVLGVRCQSSSSSVSVQIPPDARDKAFDGSSRSQEAGEVLEADGPAPYVAIPDAGTDPSADTTSEDNDGGSGGDEVFDAADVPDERDLGGPPVDVSDAEPDRVETAVDLGRPDEAGDGPSSVDTPPGSDVADGPDGDEVVRSYQLGQAWAFTLSSGTPANFALAADGALAVTTTFETSVQLSPDPDPFSSPDPRGSDDVLAVRVSEADGSLIPPSWRIDDPEGESNVQYANAVAVDSRGRTIIAGIFAGALRVGSVVLPAASADFQGFVLAVNGDGTVGWSHVYPIGNGPGVLTLDTDRARNLIVAGGAFDLEADLGCGTRVAPQERGGFVVAFDEEDGSCAFRNIIDGPGSQGVAALKVDRDGSVVVAGSFEQGLATAIDPSGPHARPGDADYFVSRLDRTGHAEWGLGITGDGQRDQFPALAIDAHGRIAMAGILTGTLPIAGRSLTSTAGSPDALAILLSPSGQTLWARQFGSDGADSARAVSFSSAGDVLVAGTFTDAVDFDGIELLTDSPQDLFLVALDPVTGACIWARAAGSNIGALPLKLLPGDGDSIYLQAILPPLDTIDIGGAVANTGQDSWNVLAKISLRR